MGFDIIFVALICGEFVRRKKLKKMTSYGLIAFYVIFSIGYKFVFFNSNNYNKVFFYNKVEEKTGKEFHGWDYFYEREHLAKIYLNVHAPILKPFWWLYSYPITYYRINYDPDFKLRKRKVDNFDLCHEEISRDNTKEERFEACSTYLLSKVKLHKEFDEDDLNFMNKHILDASVEDCREKRKYGKYFEDCLEPSVLYKLNNLIISNYKYDYVDYWKFKIININDYFSLDDIFWQLCKSEPFYGCDHLLKKRISYEKFRFVVNKICSKKPDNEKNIKAVGHKCFNLFKNNFRAHDGYKESILKRDYIQSTCRIDDQLYYCSEFSRFVYIMHDNMAEANFTFLYMTKELIEWGRRFENDSVSNLEWMVLDKYGQGFGELGSFYKDHYINGIKKDSSDFIKIPLGKDDYLFLEEELKNTSGYKKDAYSVYYIYSLLKADKKLPEDMIDKMKQKFYQGCKKKDWRYCTLGFTFEINLEIELRVDRKSLFWDITRKYCKLGFLSACHNFLGSSWNIDIKDRRYATKLFCNHNSNYNYSIKEAKKICSYHIDKIDKK